MFNVISDTYSIGNVGVTLSQLNKHKITRKCGSNWVSIEFLKNLTIIYVGKKLCVIPKSSEINKI